MYMSWRAAQLRNAVVSVTCGGVTLVILLIAPLGLAAVLINTLLVAFSVYSVGNLADRVVARVFLPPQQPSSGIQATYRAQNQTLRR